MHLRLWFIGPRKRNLLDVADYGAKDQFELNHCEYSAVKGLKDNKYAPYIDVAREA